MPEKAIFVQHTLVDGVAEFVVLMEDGELGHGSVVVLGESDGGVGGRLAVSKMTFTWRSNWSCHSRCSRRQAAMRASSARSGTAVGPAASMMLW